MRAMLLALIVIVAGCSVVDDDDIAALEQSVSLKTLSPEMRVWAANRFTAGYVRGMSNGLDGLTLGWVECHGYGRKIVEVRDMLRCLNLNQQSLYDECLTMLLAEVKRALVPDAREGDCYWDNYMYGYAPDELPDECEPDRGDAARKLVDAVLMGLPDPPPPHIQMLMISGGLFGPVGVICPLDKRGCPGNPWELPGSNDGSASGGDR